MCPTGVPCPACGKAVCVCPGASDQPHYGNPYEETCLPDEDFMTAAYDAVSIHGGSMCSRECLNGGCPDYTPQDEELEALKNMTEPALDGSYKIPQPSCSFGNDTMDGRATNCGLVCGGGCKGCLCPLEQRNHPSDAFVAGEPRPSPPCVCSCSCSEGLLLVAKRAARGLTLLRTSPRRREVLRYHLRQRRDRHLPLPVRGRPMLRVPQGLLLRVGGPEGAMPGLRGAQPGGGEGRGLHGRPDPRLVPRPLAMLHRCLGRMVCWCLNAFCLAQASTQASFLRMHGH